MTADNIVEISQQRLDELLLVEKIVENVLLLRANAMFLDTLKEEEIIWLLDRGAIQTSKDRYKKIIKGDDGKYHYLFCEDSRTEPEVTVGSADTLRQLIEKYKLTGIEYWRWYKTYQM